MPMQLINLKQLQINMITQIVEFTLGVSRWLQCCSLGSRLAQVSTSIASGSEIGEWSRNLLCVKLVSYLDISQVVMKLVSGLDISQVFVKLARGLDKRHWRQFHQTEWAANNSGGCQFHLRPI